MAKNPRKIRLMLVDDHFVVRSGLAGSLGIEPDIEVVAQCERGHDALATYRAQRPDVVTMDYELGDVTGVQAIAEIRREFPDARILCFSVFEGEEDIFRAVSAGAQGYLPKSSTRRELLTAIRAIARGEQVFPPGIAQKLTTRRSRPELNERELSVLQLIVAGNTNKEIAAQLHLAEVTVKFYVGSILEKLRVADRTQAATEAIRSGIIHLR